MHGKETQGNNRNTRVEETDVIRVVIPYLSFTKVLSPTSLAATTHTAPNLLFLFLSMAGRFPRGVFTSWFLRLAPPLRSFSFIGHKDYRPRLTSGHLISGEGTITP